jgi:RecB family exonuclease
VLWPQSACLVTELVKTLGSAGRDSLARTAVVLPTKRLATWLLAGLSQRLGTYVPPRCFTFEELIRRVVDEAGGGQGEPRLVELPELDQELILAALIQDGGYRHLKLGHEHEIRQFYAELVAWDLGDAALDRLTEAVDSDAWRSPKGLNSLKERFDELRALKARFEDALAAEGAETRDAGLARRSKALAALLEAGPLPMGLEALYVVGMTSTVGMHRPLASALARRPDVSVWINECGEEARGGVDGTGANPLAALISAFGGDPTARATAGAGDADVEPSPVEAQCLADPMAETARALEVAGAAVASGLAPSSVAILVADEARYGALVRLLLPAAPFAANVALTLPLKQTTAGAWLSTVFDALTAPTDAHSLLALLSHPRMLAFSRRLQQGTTGEATPLKTGLIAKALFAAEAGSSLADLVAQPALPEPVRTLIEHARAAFGPFLTDAKGGGRAAGGERRPLAAWWGELVVVLDRFDGGSAEDGAPGARHDRRARAIDESAAEAIETWRAAVSQTAARLPCPLSRSEFLSLVRGKLDGLEARGVGDPLAAVQVLSVEEARYVPFEVTVVVGATEGNFPKALPRDALVDGWFKRQVGLPGWPLKEAIEDTTFRLLHARLPRLTLLYPFAVGGEPTVRSRFIETLKAAGQIVEREGEVDAAKDWLAKVAPVTAGRRFDGASRREGRGFLPEGLAASLTETLSATALADLIHCPYRFALGRLGVEDVELPDEDDPMREGTWLHAVLQAFFTGKVGGRRVASPLDPALLTNPARRSEIVDRLTTLADALAPPATRASSTWLEARRVAWPTFAEHVAKLYSHRAALPGGELYGEGFREHRFDVTVSVPGAAPLRLRGSIDAVDVLGPVTLVTDYKRRGTAKRGDVLLGLEPQLLCYAVALSQGAVGAPVPLESIATGYWSILGGEWVPGASGRAAQPVVKAIGLEGAKMKGDLETSVAHMLGFWKLRHDAHVSGGAPFAPEASERCAMCSFGGVCRRDDPETPLDPHAPTPFKEAVARLKGSGKRGAEAAE